MKYMKEVFVNNLESRLLNQYYSALIMCLSYNYRSFECTQYSLIYKPWQFRLILIQIVPAITQRGNYYKMRLLQSFAITL